MCAGWRYSPADRVERTEVTHRTAQPVVLSAPQLLSLQQLQNTVFQEQSSCGAKYYGMLVKSIHLQSRHFGLNILITEDT